jgi:hypothetical protein
MERAASEERGKASVLVQAEREKGALQEQLSFLKGQLQYALKASSMLSQQRKPKLYVIEAGFHVPSHYRLVSLFSYNS